MIKYKSVVKAPSIQKLLFHIIILLRIVNDRENKIRQGKTIPMPERIGRLSIIYEIVLCVLCWL